VTVKSVQIATKSNGTRSPITSARPIDDHAAAATAHSNEHSARLEAKLDLVLTHIVTLSIQFDAKLTAFNDEVKADQFNAALDTRNNQLDSCITKWQSFADTTTAEFNKEFSKVKRQTDELEKWLLDLAERIDTTLVNTVKENQNLSIENLNGIRLRTRVYDANFRKLPRMLKSI